MQIVDAKSASQKSWINQIDYVRGIAILAVLVVHCFPPIPYWRIGIAYSHINGNIQMINSFIHEASIFGVPLFIFITGVVLAHNYPIATFDALSFITRRLFQILPPYFIISAASIIGLGIVNGFPSVTRIVFQLLTGSANNGLWFVVLIIQFYLLYPWILRIYDYFSKKNRIIYLLLISILIRWIWIIALPGSQNPESDELNMILWRIFLPYLVFFVAGIYAKYNFATLLKVLEKQRLPLLIIISLLLIGLLGYNSVYHISSIITVIVQTAYYFVIFIISFKIATVLTQKSNITSITLRSIGDYSFGMYLIHPFVMYILVIAFLKIGNMDYNNWFFYLILFIATSIFSYIVTSIISRLPYSQFIIGIANKRKRGL